MQFCKKKQDKYGSTSRLHRNILFASKTDLKRNYTVHIGKRECNKIFTHFKKSKHSRVPGTPNEQVKMFSRNFRIFLGTVYMVRKLEIC